jgi:hypothetical protein
MLLETKGSSTSDVYVLVERPLAADADKGYLYSSGLGYVFDKMMQNAGIPDYCVKALRPDLQDNNSCGNWLGAITQYKPAVIIPLDGAGKWLLDQLRVFKNTKKTRDSDSEIAKYAGSVMQSPRLNWPCYIIPTYGPAACVKDWKLRDIVTSIDLGKAASELAYFRANARTLEPLPQITSKIDFESFDELLYILDQMRGSEYISNDIETIYPRAPTKTQPSQFYKILPGYPITVGLATNTTFGISFELFRNSIVETRELWKRLAILLRDSFSVGQNFFNFDANFYEMLGFKLPLEHCRDTMILHHLLWPELPHKLQFLARQYTRQQFWKDEGAGWSLKNMAQMKRYNVKDVCVTMEIFYAELEEMKARGIS